VVIGIGGGRSVLETAFDGFEESYGRYLAYMGEVGCITGAYWFGFEEI
jgi:hypothetical protein